MDDSVDGNAHLAPITVRYVTKRESDINADSFWSVAVTAGSWTFAAPPRKVTDELSIGDVSNRIDGPHGNNRSGFLRLLTDNCFVSSPKAAAGKLQQLSKLNRMMEDRTVSININYGLSDYL